MTGRIALGTAQFGLDYGVANQAGRISASAAKAILNLATKNELDTLDTAIAYGNSEAVLGSAGIARWRIVTKLPALPSGVEDCGAWVRGQVSGSLERLGVARIDALLLHRPQDLLGAQGPAYRQALQRLKLDGVIRAAGVSIYRPDELDALWPVFRPDLVQAPFNVFDRRLETSGWLRRLSGEGVRVHTRSAFLQGLLLMPSEKRPGYFKPWELILDSWHGWCRQSYVSALAAALGYCLSHEHVERVVVGVDSVAQLEEILAATEQTVPSPPAALSSEDRALIEPSQWKL
jgi:hypothetical protein